MSTRLPSTIVRRRRGLQPPPLSVGAVTDKILVRYEKKPCCLLQIPFLSRLGTVRDLICHPYFVFAHEFCCATRLAALCGHMALMLAARGGDQRLTGWPHGVDLCCCVHLSFVQMSVARMFSKLLRPTMARINPVARRAFGTILCFLFFFVLNY